MKTESGNPLVGNIEQALEAAYAEALTYAVRYGAGWEEARQTFGQLHAFKNKLTRNKLVRLPKHTAAKRVA